MMDSKINWFSKEFATMVEAQRDTGASGFFEPYGIFENHDGKYVWANLRQRQFDRTEIEAIHDNILELTGFKLVSFRDALFGWMEFKR